MNFLYAINPSSPKPIFQINRHIGFDKDLGQGINGMDFSREVFELDAEKKSLLTFYINCVGGKVQEGYDIFNAIVVAKSKTRSVFQGFGFSSGGWCGLGADVVDAFDYSLFMCHLAHNPNDQSNDSPFLTRVSGTIAQIISNKSGRNGKPKMTYNQVMDMLNTETYLTAYEMLELGLIDNIIASDNKVKKIEVSNIANKTVDYSYYQEVSNIFVQKEVNNKIMIHPEVASVLNLSSGSDDMAAVSAIANIKNSLTEVTNLKLEAEKKVNTMTGELNAVNIKIAEVEATSNMVKAEKEVAIKNLEAQNLVVTELTEKLEAANLAKTEAENKIKASEDAAKKVESLSVINKFVEAGKIEDKEEVVNGWVDMHMDNPTQTMLVLGAISTNVHAPKAKEQNTTEPNQASSNFDRFRIDNQKRLEEEQKRISQATV